MNTAQQHVIRVRPGFLTDAGLEWLGLTRRQAERNRCRYMERWNRDKAIAGGSGTFSNFSQTTILAHLTGQDNASWANLSPVYLALCTAVPDSSKTGSTITEAGYTGYARLSFANTDFSSAVSGGAGGQSTIANSGTKTFAACTASSSTIIGWDLASASSAGNSLAWGSCTSTVISTTQTPATVAASALSLGLT